MAVHKLSSSGTLSYKIHAKRVFMQIKFPGGKLNVDLIKNEQSTFDKVFCSSRVLITLSACNVA